MKAHSIKFLFIYSLTILCLLPCLNAKVNDSTRVNTLNDEKAESILLTIGLG